MNTVEKLDRYAELETEVANNLQATNEKRQMLDAEKEKLLASILTPEQLVQMSEIKAEFVDKYESLNNNDDLKAKQSEMSALEKEIQAETIVKGETIKAENHKVMCVFTPAKAKSEVIVDTGMLKGLTLTIPKLKECWHEEVKTMPAKAYIR